ncbi:hypothetical protein CCC13826_1044 [Campylobacter concisus 13826]|uniref:Uncharacterized protein n=1 Tax=Campylobacter concisus (strain 13826) TaxID=360104 RepID=A7ZD41_CAMC1|nr:hypothetical protein CCC13826_1044 [Campylobacter concisus 13826]
MLNLKICSYRCSFQANQANQEKQINLTRNFHKNGKKFYLVCKNNLKLSHF